MNKDWEILEGKYNIMLINLKSRFPNHLSIVRYGNFYQVYDTDATFFENHFSFNSYIKFGKLTCGFPTFSTNYFDELRNMKKSFVRVDQLPEKKNGKIIRAISEIYTGRDSDKSENVSYSRPSIKSTQIPNEIKRKNTPKKLSSNTLPKIRPDQETSPSRGAPGKPMRTHSPEQVDNFPKQYIDEPTGSREDFKKMRGKQHFRNKTGNH